MPLRLAEQQRAMAADILGSPARDGSPALTASIRLPLGVDVETRLDIHRQGYPARIAEALEESFPAIATILGGESFHSLAGDYTAGIRKEPSNLNSIGANLPAFLARSELTRSLPFLPDLAGLEWAVVECFHAERHPPFDMSVCSDWSLDDWSEAKIEFQPATRLLRSAWPIRELRDAREVERSEIDIDLVDRPDQVLVYRADFDVVTESLDDSDALIFESLARGCRLGEVSLTLAEAGAAPARMSELFARWTASGLVRDCRVGEGLAPFADDSDSG